MRYFYICLMKDSPLQDAEQLLIRGFDYRAGIAEKKRLTVGFG